MDVFQNEIYTQIIKHVADMETRDLCTEVSRAFRLICQEDLLFAEGLTLEPSHACQGCDEADSIPDWFGKYDVATGTHSQVTWKGGSGFVTAEASRGR